jgi:hypothetical protein
VFVCYLYTHDRAWAEYSHPPKIIRSCQLYEDNTVTQLLVICSNDTTAVHNVKTVSLLHVRAKYLGSMVVEFAYEVNTIKLRSRTASMCIVQLFVRCVLC